MCILTLNLFSGYITKLLWWLSSLYLRQCAASLLLCGRLIPFFQHKLSSLYKPTSCCRGMIVPVLGFFKPHHGHTIRIVDHDPLEVEIVSLEVLGFVDHSTLQGWELIIDRHLVAFNHPLSVIGMLALFCIVDKVLVIDCILLDNKIGDWR